LISVHHCVAISPSDVQRLFWIKAAAFIVDFFQEF
jgi:hypothetical protein